MKSGIRFTFILFWIAAACASQTTSTIHLFQNYVWDADVTDRPYDEVFIDLRSYEFGSTTNFGIKGGFALSPQWEMNGQLSLATLSITQQSSHFGLSDLVLSSRYIPYQNEGTVLGLGGQLFLPLGDNDVGYGKGGFGLFGALRRQLGAKTVLAASMGLDVVPEHAGAGENVAALKISGGWIRRLNSRTHFIAEAVLISRVDYLVFSGGLDHLLDNGAHLRAVIGLGVADESPKVIMSAAYTFSF